MKKLTLTIILLTILNSLYSQTIDIEIQNPYISLGEWTTLKVTASGDIKSINYSDPVGMTITQIGNNSSISTFNGKKTTSYILSFRIKPLKKGELLIPTFYIENSNDEMISSIKTKLYVNEKKQDSPSNHNYYSSFESEFVKLYIDLPERNLYVGEAVPVKMTAYFSTKYQPRIERHPYMKTGSFLLDTGENYTNDQPEVLIDGEKWIQIEWNSHLTPLKAGELDLEIVFDSYIEIPSGNSGFFSSSKREEFKTSTELQTVDIKTLPSINKPIGFTGAIGNFSMDSSLTPLDAQVGDPLTLTFDIYGQGNFQRITMPQITSDLINWKLYPETSTYKGSNKSNFMGIKSFQQILSPTSIDINSSPTLDFSYFDPEKEKYIILKNEILPLNITPGTFQDKEISEKLNENFKEMKQEMRHKKSSKTTNFSSIIGTPIYSILTIISSIFISLSIIFQLLLYRKKRPVDKTSKEQRSLLSQIKKCENEENFTQALELYTTIIKKSISSKRNINSDSIASSDLKNNVLKKVLQKSEEIKYSNKSIKSTEYIKITDQIMEQLK
ncbi:MAG: BatD family protein [Spirochaetaceae bacterium]